MNIYLASNYGRRDEMLTYAKTLRELGHTITSSWIYTAWEERGDGGIPVSENERIKWANIDLQDLLAANLVINFTGSGRRGGRHVELGMAIAWGKHIVIVGEKEHIFHYLGYLLHYAHFQEILDKCPLIKLRPRESFSDNNTNASPSGHRVSCP